LGWLRIKGSTCRLSGQILYASVTRTADRWFMSLTVAKEIAEPAVPMGEAVGIDLGIKVFATLSDGTIIESPRALLHNLRQLRALNKALARSQRNSARRKEVIQRLARKHARVANIRNTFIHQTTIKLVREHPAIGLEDLAVGNLQRNHKLARAIVDQGWGEFRRQLSYKAAWYGAQVVVADRFFPSSQLCSGCGHRQAMPLEIRLFICGSCGLEIDRDLNAAINLRPVAVLPTETLNAHGGDVSPDSVWQIPMKCEPSSQVLVA
jgi:putative transposase